VDALGLCGCLWAREAVVAYCDLFFVPTVSSVAIWKRYIDLLTSTVSPVFVVMR